MRRPSRAFLLAALLATCAGAEAPLLAQANAAAAAPLSGDTWAAASRAKKGDVTVAYYYPLQGFAYHDESGQLTGVNIEVMRQLEAYLRNVRGVDLTIRWIPYGDFADFYQAVRTGRGGVIGLAGTTITEARKREVAFAPSFFSNRAVLVTHSSVPQLPGRDAIPARLAGFTALALNGTTLEARLRALQAAGWSDLEIEVFEALGPLVERLVRDPKTFAYLDLNMYWLARKNQQPLTRHTAADEPPEDLAYIVPLGSDWVTPMAEFFSANGGYRNSRAYRQLMIKHLGIDLRDLLDTGAP
jgi:putative glutamine transport system substrate-binding protein